MASNIRLDPPEADYAFTPEERNRLRQGFDVAALERLMAAVRPEYRQDILRYFRWAEGGVLVKMGDPVLQRLLEETWAGHWDEASTELLMQMAQDPNRLPGVEVELARRRDT